MEGAIVIESSPEGPSRHENKNDMDNVDVADSNGNGAASSPPAGNATTTTLATGGETSNDTMNSAEKQQQQQQFDNNDNNNNTHNNNNGANGGGNAAEQKQQQQQHVKGQPVILGGNQPIAAFCLLQGFLEVPAAAAPSSSPDKTSPSPRKTAPKSVSVPIDRLPAMLGRTHQTTDKNFFGLGKNVKALSRVQCCIEYRIKTGKIGQYSSTSKFSYQPTTSSKTNKKDKKNNKPPSSASQPEEEEIILNPTNAIKDEAGFYVITCKGKNPIRVNGIKVDQDQTCLLTHGSVIKISSFCLYFLLPSTLSTKTMEITITNTNSSKASSAASAKAENGGGNVVVPTKKRKAPEMLLSTANAATRAIPKVAASSSSLSIGGGGAGDPFATAKRGGGRGAAWRNVQEELDKKSTQELLQLLQEADENGLWDRKCQFVGGTVSYRAVMEAAKSTEIQQMSGPDGVGKAQIVEWINTSHQFGPWAQLMQSKLEPKSYQSSIANAMRKAGFERSGSTNFGRHVKWLLPSEFQKSGGGGGGGGGNTKQNSSQPQRGESDDDDSDHIMANSNNNDNDEESDGGNDDDDDDDDDNVQDDDVNNQNAVDSGGPDESDNDSDSDNEG